MHRYWCFLHARREPPAGILKADADGAIDAFGKTEKVKKVFWALFTGLTGIVLAQVPDPETARQILGIITGMVG